MHMQRLIRPFLMVLCLLFGSQLVGCGTGDSEGTSGSSDVGAAPILLHDPSPGQLEAHINVTMGGYDPTTRETTSVGLSFSSNGRLVQFAGHERLTCNGIAVPLQNQVASLQVVQAPTSTLEGRPFSCTYSAGGTSATLLLTIPYAPVIRSPQDRAQVPRSTHTLITYEVRSEKLLGIVALGPEAKAIAELDTPSRMHATVDTSTFSTGAGSLSLTQTLNLQVTQTGAPFKSLGAGGTAMTMITVTWV